MISQVWTEQERAAWKLPDELTVSEWCNRNRILDARYAAEAGRYRVDRTPYAREILESFRDKSVDEITLLFSTQTGKTTIVENCLLWAIDNDPAPALFVLPNEDMCRSLSANRFRPTLEASLPQHLPVNQDDLAMLEYRLPRMTIRFVGSGSPSALASRPIRYLFLDETDKFPSYSGKEADPIQLARERTKTFWNKKVVKSSTPTTRLGYIWREYEQSDRRQYHVPCPHCGKYQPLIFGQVKWEEGKPETANYECQHCNERITDANKPQMLLRGVWCPEGCIVDDAGHVLGDAASHHRGYWLNALYSPWLTFADVACEFIASKQYTGKLQNFVNSWLAEVWEEKLDETTEDDITVRCTDYPKNEVHQDVILLTAGVDVQQDHFWYVIRGWATNKTSYLVCADRCNTFDDLAQVLYRTAYKKPNGELLMVSRAMVDSGYKTSEVYTFCAQRRDILFACKGQQHIYGAPYKSADIGTHSLKLWHIDTTFFKDDLYRMIHCTEDDITKWYCHENVSPEYIDQMTAEHKVIDRNKKTGEQKEIWALREGRQRNHYWDCEVYSLAAADMMKLRLLPQFSVAYVRPRAQQQQQQISTGFFRKD